MWRISSIKAILPEIHGYWEARKLKIPMHNNITVNSRDGLTMYHLAKTNFAASFFRWGLMTGVAALLFAAVTSHAAADGSEDGLILFIQEQDLEMRPREEAWGLPSKVLRDDVEASALKNAVYGATSSEAGGQFLMFFDGPGIYGPRHVQY
jgi:hypothetical protein